MREESRVLGPARDRLVARYELYRESFQLDLARYQEQSEKMIMMMMMTMMMMIIIIMMIMIMMVIMVH